MTAAYLRPKAAAKHFGLSESTLARWAEAGRISTSLVDGCRWYSCADIAAVIEGGVTRRTVLPMSAPVSSAPDAWEGLEAWAAKKRASRAPASRTAKGGAR